jgi:hypothetical protein
MMGLAWGLIFAVACLSSSGCQKKSHLSGLVPAKGVVKHNGSPVEHNFAQ